MIKNDHGVPFSAIATAGTTPVVASKSGAVNTTIYITDISGSSDLAGATITLTSTPTGGNLWQDIVGAGNYRMNFITPLKAILGETTTLTVTGTVKANANMAGFILNNT